jgi:hypothetical protein
MWKLEYRWKLSLHNFRLQTGRPGFDHQQRQRNFPVASVFRPALRPTQPPIQWVQGFLTRQ